MDFKGMPRKVLDRSVRLVRRVRYRLRGDLGVTDRGFLRAVRPEFRGVGAPYFLRREKGHGPRFFFDPGDRGHLVRALRKLFPQAEKKVLSAAEDIMKHRFDLLGSGPTPLGRSIDWNADFSSGYKWDSVFYTDVPVIDPARTGVDVKVPWELSRFQHLPTLGRAYWYTAERVGDDGRRRRPHPDRYAREFVAEISDWIGKNPPGSGVNWACTMDVALRAVNWLWGYHFFCSSPALTDEFRRRFFKSLLEHGRHIRGNLEYSEVLTGNHYLSDIVGLIVLGLLVPEFVEAGEWKDFGVQEIEKEMQKQVLPDGMDFEASVPYHRLAVELFATAYLLLKINGTVLSLPFREKLEKMFECVMYYTRPDGLAPQIGDADDGRVQILSGYPKWERRDHRYLCTLGGHLFNREDMKACGRGEEIFFLLNGGIGNPAATPPGVPSPGSRGFSDAGIYVMRHEEKFLLADCGGNGQRGRGGHAHNDTLSIEVAVGEPFIVDPGTYVYTSDEKLRNAFRSTASHNTIAVNGEEINRFVPGGFFQLSDDAHPTVLRWETSPEYDYLDAEHDGYARLRPPVFHRRQVYFDRKEGLWILRDRLHHGGGDQGDRSKISCEMYFHFDPGVTVTRTKAPLPVRDAGGKLRQMAVVSGEKADLLHAASSTYAVKARSGGRTVFLRTLGPKGVVMTVGSGWVSPRYGFRRRAPVVTFHHSGACPLEFITLIVPV